VLVGDQENLEVVAVERAGQRSLADALAGLVLVHPGFGELEARIRVLHGARERHEHADVEVALLLEVGLEGLLVADRMPTRARDAHRFAAAIVPGPALRAEVLDDHLRLLRNAVRLQTPEARELSRRLLRRHAPIVPPRLHLPVI